MWNNLITFEVFVHSCNRYISGYLPEIKGKFFLSAQRKRVEYSHKDDTIEMCIIVRNSKHLFLICTCFFNRTGCDVLLFEERPGLPFGTATGFLTNGIKTTDLLQSKPQIILLNKRSAEIIIKQFVCLLWSWKMSSSVMVLMLIMVFLSSRFLEGKYFFETFSIPLKIQFNNCFSLTGLSMKNISDNHALTECLNLSKVITFFQNIPAVRIIIFKHDI